MAPETASRLTVATWQAGSSIARLPRGIGAVRPHLEHVDNVPLLVSLFTDSTPDTAREMYLHPDGGTLAKVHYGRKLRLSKLAPKPKPPAKKK